MIPENARENLNHALIKAGKVLLSYYGRQIKARVKESISSVVTEADLAAEKVILEILNEASGEFNIITEETGYINHGSEYTWVVDPLDGTSNFAAGLPWFGVIIALLYKQTPVLGGMYLPVSDDLFLAEQGEVSKKNGEPVIPTHSSVLEDQLIAYSFDFSDTPGKTESEMEILKKLSKRVRNIRSTNSLVDFCYVADGRLGAALNQTTKIWDIAVPWLLIREAGGKVTDINGEEIFFDLTENGVNLNYTIAASGSALQKELLNLINPNSPAK
ncbi:MAG: inositol monophosphatase [Bacteroidetes bacterium]|nr:inositol monophosphatase [Bacteroidota bacterium]